MASKRIPPKSVQRAAQRALDTRAAAPPSQRAMTPTGIARARDLAAGRAVSDETVRRMKAFFDRHDGTRPDGPVEGSKWKQAWDGWGGDAGRAWANREVEALNREREP